MNKQEIFDKVYMHLLTQKRKSTYSRGCAYRGSDGAMCAVGCLIRDEHYDPKLEGLGVGSTHIVNALISSGVFERDDPDWSSKMRLLNDLQSVHDNNPSKQWQALLDSTAWRYKLTTPELKNEQHS